MKIHDERPQDELTAAGSSAAFSAALKRAFDKGPRPGLTGAESIAACVDEAMLETVYAELALRSWPEK